MESDLPLGIDRPRPRHQVSRAAIVLEYIASRSETATLADIVAGTGLPKSTVHRLLGTLVEEGMARRSGLTYVIGDRILALGPDRAGGISSEVRHVLLAYVTRLHHLTGMASVLCVPVQDHVMVAEVVFSPGQEDVAPSRGARLTPHRTAPGLILMANDPAFATRAMSSLAMAGGASTGTDPLALLVQLRQTRAAGVGSTDGLRAAGISELAVALRGKRSRPLASLGVCERGSMPFESSVIRTLRQVSYEGALAARRAPDETARR